MNEVKLDIWDTAGQERYRMMAPLYYRGANGCIAVYDITNYKSFEALKTWIQQLQQFMNQIMNDGVAVVIAGNKIDLEQQRDIENDEVETYAKEIGAKHILVSAKTAQNINELFKSTAEEIIKHKSNTGNRFKVILLGECSVGKSSINQRWTKGTFTEYQESTIGASFSSKSLRVSGTLNPASSLSVSAMPPAARSMSGGFGFAMSGLSNPFKSSISKKSTSNTIGLSMGGAKDTVNFRECIAQNMMPQSDAITHSGLLYEYQFDTSSTRHLNKCDNVMKDDGAKEGDDEKYEADGSMLFYPTYCYAKIKKIDFAATTDDMKSDDNLYAIKDKRDEYYMTVGLNSNIKQDEFKRKHLNLVLVLDKSGSMSDSFTFAGSDTKMLIASECVIALLKHLTDKDRFGMVVFDRYASTIQTLQFVDAINMKELETQIVAIYPGGGTNLEEGYREAVKMFANIEADEAYEQRIIYLTDAQPTVDSNPLSLTGLVSSSALNEHKRIYTTIIGIGLDFNNKLVQKMSKTRGCNYYTVSSKKEFVQRMDVEFEYMVTPLVFNVLLKLKCEGNSCRIEKVFGSNDEESILNNGEITRIDTLFPSKRDEESGEVQGGILLIKLAKVNANDTANINVVIEVTFDDTNGKSFKNEQNVTFAEHQIKQKMEDMIEYDDDEDSSDLTGNYYDNNGIRKGILLCSYVEILKEWMQFEEKRGSNNLRVSAKYKQIFTHFLKYFKEEMKICQDDKLQQEVEILNKLISIGNDDDKSDGSSIGSYLYSMYTGLKKTWYG